MPVNRNALIRFRTIDNCLQNRFRKWTLNDLIDACSDALYEYEGIDKGVSKRTVQADIQIMRSDKLGYNAPIIVVERKYYTYEDKEYSITNIPLTDQDLNQLMEVVEILKQFKGFSHFRELDGMVQKLEDKVYSSKTQTESVIDFEKNENLRGLDYLDDIYKAVLKKQTLELTYQSFRARMSSTFNFYPYLLKEYRNRWFVIGVPENVPNLLILALDRIQELKTTDLPFQVNQKYDLKNYFNQVVGVTITENGQPQEIQIFVDKSNAPYVITKPIHPSQKVLEQNDDGIIISLAVQINFELEREILGFGESMTVLKPERLRTRIRQRLEWALSRYRLDE
ncbi:MAG: WYL domain-containing protein [Bacteroidetes bacterium]|nr:WYL domain-containing protein [Bacteroidota bacterium]